MNLNDVNDIDELDFGTGRPLHATDAKNRLLNIDVLEESRKNGDTPSSTSSNANNIGTAPKSVSRGSSSLIERIRQKQLEKAQQASPEDAFGLGYKAPSLISTDDFSDVDKACNTDVSSEDTQPIRDIESNLKYQVPAREIEETNSNFQETSKLVNNSENTRSDHSYSYSSPPEPPSFSRPSLPDESVLSQVRDGMISVGNGMKKMMVTGSDVENHAPLLTSHYQDDATDRVEYSMKAYFVTFCRDMYGFTIGRLPRNGQIAVVLVLLLSVLWILSIV